MVVAKVALGKIKKYYEHDMTTEKAPEGYNSTHGVANSNDVESQFEVGALYSSAWVASIQQSVWYTL